MATVPAAGDVQTMITRELLTAAIFFGGTVLSAATTTFAYIKPGVIPNPVGGAVFGVLFVVLFAVFLHLHEGNPRRQRTILKVIQLEGSKPRMNVRYMDGTEETIPADGKH